MAGQAQFGPVCVDHVVLQRQYFRVDIDCRGHILSDLCTLHLPDAGRFGIDVFLTEQAQQGSETIWKRNAEVWKYEDAGMQSLAWNGPVMRVIGISKHLPHQNDELAWSIDVEYQ